MIVVVPSKDMKERGLTPTRKEIREDAVAVLKEMVKKCEPHGIKLSLEFCGEPAMTINRFEDAYAIVEEVGSPMVGVTLDQYHFYAMGSGWDTLEKADGKKIFVWHLNGTEDLPCGCYYNNDEYSFNKPYSDKTAQLIDEEVKAMIAAQYERAKALLTAHKDGHAELARVLVEREVIFAEDVERIFGKRPWTSRTEELLTMNGQTDGQDTQPEEDNTVKDENEGSHYQK